MKKELLCPVGSKESFHAAVHNGADAIYLGGKSFGARAHAPNFSNDEIAQAIKYAHLYDVKVYVTVNTLISDTEFDEAIDFILFLHKNNVDAVILQDIGLASIISKMCPNLELHASTQMHNLDKFTIHFLENLGFKRVVLARETSLEDINKLDTNMELEVFIHGALCMSYSGACLLSSMAMNRSGNRGSCSQLCRMPYKLYVDNRFVDMGGNYLLSPKDLFTTYIFDEIMNSNITSLKIEGRMKSSQYVAVVTRMYRKLIDAFYTGTEVDIEKEEEDLKQLFNRGYGLGHLKENNSLVNPIRGNHKGVLIGKTTDVNDKFITIKLSNTLYVGDGLKFENSDKGMNVFNIYINRVITKEAKDGDVITIPNNVGLKENDNILKTVDVRLNNELLKYEEKKIEVNFDVRAIDGEALEIKISDLNYEFIMKGNIISKAINKEVTYDDIYDKVTKLGNTPFKVREVNINKSDNIFVPISEINNIRRDLVLKLKEARENKHQEVIINDKDITFDDVTLDEELSVYIRNKEQLDVIRKYPVKRIYTSNYELYKDNLDLFYDVNINDDYNFNNSNLLVNSTSDIIKYSGNNLVLNYGINVYNSYSIDYLSKYGVCTYSPELKLEDLSKFNRKINKLSELLIYGRVKVMTMKHCLTGGKCNACNLKNKRRELEDSFGRKYIIECNKGINCLYDHKDVLKIKDLRELRFIGIKRFRIDFFEETEKEIKKIMNDFYQLN